ncbi:class I SAM-dependent methyltransferase [Emcibacter sp. SYSU 3D8]|uniref:class I SAM-dependent methyltransferase n=1 Tax=Emcibacter sp. SYSU 3D8 TaxID=3133969 RepID=UPI0031FEA06D
MRDEATLQFYADQASAYVAGTRRAPAARLAGFLARLAPGAAILELGCGGGVDAAEMLMRGFAVDATDGSPEMAREARMRLGRRVRVMAFDALDAEGGYDAVWANACLLHVPMADLPGVLARIHRALKPAGLFYAGYKSGAGEGRDGLGRYYNFPGREALAAAYGQAAHWAELEMEESHGKGYDGVDTPWLHVLARRAG